MAENRPSPTAGVQTRSPDDLGARPGSADLGVRPESADLGIRPENADLGIRPGSADPGMHAGNTDLGIRPESADLGIRPATAEDVQRLKTLLAEAFFDDPVFGWLMPEDGKRHARLRRYFGVDLSHYVLPRGLVWTTGDLTGASLTLPPGKWRVPPHTTLLQGSAFGVHLLKAARMGAAMEWRHARELRGPHYYVRDIGVHPDMQGKGLGGALLRPTLDRCDREGLPAYIEASSERSAALYERLGFQHVKELRVGGSPPLWLMIRPPLPAR